MLGESKYYRSTAELWLPWLMVVLLPRNLCWVAERGETLFVRGEKSPWRTGLQRTPWFQCQAWDLWGQETRVKYEAAWLQSCLKLTLFTLEDNQGTDCSTALHSCQSGERTSGWLMQSLPGTAYVHSHAGNTHSTVVPHRILHWAPRYLFKFPVFVTYLNIDSYSTWEKASP